MKNMHLSLTPFLNETRVLKESISLIESGLVSEIMIVAMHEGNLLDNEFIYKNVLLRRIKLKTKNFGNLFLIKILKYIELLHVTTKIMRSFKPQVLTIHSIALLPLAIISKVIFGVELVYDCHELETETFLLSGTQKKLAKLVEKFCIKYVDLVVVVSENIEYWYRNKYHLKNIITVKNAPNKKQFSENDILRKTFDIDSNNKILIYLGGIIRGRGVEELLHCFKELSQTEFVIVFMGYGELVDLVLDHQDKYPNIFYHPAVEASKVTEYASSADIGIAYIKNGCLNDNFCLPNKLFECIFSNLPMLVSDSPDMANLVQGYNVGVVLNDLTPESIISGINSINKIHVNELKSNIAKLIDENCWEVQAQKLINGYRIHLKN